MNATFEIGETVFSEYGQEAEVIAVGNSSIIVRPVYVGHEEEPSWGAIEEWRKAFSAAPVAKFNAKIAELDAEIAAKRTEISGLSLEKHLLEKDAKERMARLKQHKGLERLDLFVEGKITHYVITESYYAPQILEASAAVYDDGNRWNKDKPLRLLILFGNSKGDLNWKLSHYSDGSGGSQEVDVFTSEADAVAFLSQYCESKYADWRSDPTKLYIAERTASGAAKHGLPIPEDLSDAIKANRIEIATKELAKANEAAIAAHKKFTEAQAV